MCCASQTRINRKQTKKQVMALAFLVCFIVVSLLSGAFVAIQADHAHDHNGVHGACAICTGIQNAEAFLTLLGTTVVGGFASAARVWLYIAAVMAGAIWVKIVVLTPITAKIRMNN